MNFAESLRGLLRRWYIVLPGLLLVASIAVGVWFAVPTGYNRSATQLMIPGQNSIPEGANPYLFLGGLAPAADVLVRAIGSENVLNDVVKGRPGTEIEVTTAGTAGPIILIEVTASNDAAAEEVLTMLVDRTAKVLNEIQNLEDIPEQNRMTIVPVTIDEESEEQPRSRILAAAGVGAIGTVLVLLIASLIDGSRRRRQGFEASMSSEPIDAEPEPGSPDAGGATDTRPAPARPAPHTQSPANLEAAEYLPAASRSRVKW
ncbi:MAG: hypothetical protein ABWY26_03120 [Microbacterium sp.]